jgi:hypothetical protein
MEVLNTMLRQIGAMNIMAISGGRKVVVDESTLRFPVSSGYHVEVEYKPALDLYSVRRVTIRKANGLPVRKIKGELTHLYADQVGEQAYQASCYKNVIFGVA